eukprot:1432234-Heterocapsa_arctica.AAC.1
MLPPSAGTIAGARGSPISRCRPKSRSMSGNARAGVKLFCSHPLTACLRSTRSSASASSRS